MISAELARSQIGVEEYLELTFDDRPEPNYVDGEVFFIERVRKAVMPPCHQS
jgi:hypothetical protein